MHTPQCIDLLEWLDSPAPTLEMYAFTTPSPSHAMYSLISRAVDDVAGGVDESELHKLNGIVDLILAGNPRLCDLHPIPSTLQ